MFHVKHLCPLFAGKDFILDGRLGKSATLVGRPGKRRALSIGITRTVDWHKWMQPH
jgi:hypothetical protein